MSMFEVLPSLKFLYKCHCTLHLNLASEMDPHFTLYLNCFLLFSKCLFVRRKRKAQSHQLLIQIFSCLANFCRRLPAGNENIKWDNPQQTSGLRQSPPRPGTHRGRGRRTSFVRSFMRFHFDRTIKIDIARASIEYLPCLTYETLIMRKLCTVPRPPRLASLVSCLVSHLSWSLHATQHNTVTAVVPRCHCYQQQQHFEDICCVHRPPHQAWRHVFVVLLVSALDRALITLLWLRTALTLKNHFPQNIKGLREN